MDYTQIKLLIFDEEFQIIDYSVNFSQGGNTQRGGATATVTGNQISIKIESDGENNFVKWMIDATGEQEGSIEFHNGQNIVKTIKFSGAVLVGYSQNSEEIITHAPHENFDENGIMIAERSSVLTESLKINYREVDFGKGVKFTKGKV